MKEPIIHITDKNEHYLNYNIYATEIYFEYDGTLFTGTIVERDGRSYTEYTNGNEDGLSIFYYENGQIESEVIMVNGQYHGGKEWYKNGQLKSDNNHYYDENGKLIRLNGSWLYPNGVKRNKYDISGEYHIYSPDNRLAIKTIVNNKGDFKNTVIYYDDVLMKNYLEIFTNYYPKIEESFYNIEYKIAGWIALKYLMNKKTGIDLMRQLINHPNENIKRITQIRLDLIEQNKFDAKKSLKIIGYHSEIK